MSLLPAVVLPAAGVARIVAAAQRAYPEECCGLLIGRRTRLSSEGEVVAVSEVAESANVVASRRRDRFEVDPALRFALIRRLRVSSDRIVGHYHSHPDAPARPSRYDADAAFEADLIWLIVSVVHGIAAGEPAAFLYDPQAGGFSRLAVSVTD